METVKNPELDDFTFTLFHVDDDPRVRKRVEALEGSLDSAFQEWFDETFHYGANHPHSVRLKLYSVDSLSALSTVLFDTGGSVATGLSRFVQQEEKTQLVLSQAGRRAVCFLLDYYLEDYDEGPLLGMEWEVRGRIHTAEVILDSYFPATPKVLLTRTDPLDIGDRPADYEYWHKGILYQDGISRKLQKLLTQRFEPSFLRLLMEYGRLGNDSWHTPGHNRGNAFIRSNTLGPVYEAYQGRLFNTDISVSVESLGDLSEPEHRSPLMSAQRRSAATFGACDTYYVTNGTSTSNRAMLMALLRPGDVILLDRNCHKSVHQAVTLSGALPLYLQPAYNETLGIWAPVSWLELSEQLEKEYPADLQPRMLILTTCTYEGILYPIHRIAEICNRKGIIFYADEAWAPYLRFHPYYVDAQLRSFSALGGGAHFAVQSTHKALAALSQASMIHVSPHFRDILQGDDTGWGSTSPWRWLRNRFRVSGIGSYERFKHGLAEVLRYAHSTSPLYPLIASLDGATTQMAMEGKRLIAERLEWVTEFYETLEKIAPDSIVRIEDILEDPADFPEYRKDPLKILIQCRSARATDLLKQHLRENHIQWEKSTPCTVQFLVTVGTFMEHLYGLLDVLQQHRELLGRGTDDEVSKWDFTTQGCVMSPRQAALASDTEFVSLDQCMRQNDEPKRIAAQMVVPYPPGIPVILPGMEIKNDSIARVKKTVRDKGAEAVHGLYVHERRDVDEKQYYILVVAEDAVSRESGDAKKLQMLNEQMYKRA